MNFGTEYVECPADDDTQVSTKAGTLLERLIVSVQVADATGIAAIQDGEDTAIELVPPGAAIGVYSIPIGARCRGAGWTISCGAGATAVAVGRFLAP